MRLVLPLLKEAACRDVADPDVFFPDDEDDERAIQAAAEICGVCQSQPECLDFAVQTAQPYGIWGGYPQRALRRLVEADRNGNSCGNLGHFNAAKDRCKHGHKFTKANTSYDAAGRRHCRTCWRAAQARLRERRRSA